MTVHAEGPRMVPVARYLAAVAASAVALGLRLLLEPLTGSGAPFVLAVAAVLVVSLFIGIGPGLVALALTASLTASLSVARLGFSIPQTAAQTLLYAADGLIILYAAWLVAKRQRSLDDANRELRRLSVESLRAEARRGARRADLGRERAGRREHVLLHRSHGGKVS